MSTKIENMSKMLGMYDYFSNKNYSVICMRDFSSPCLNFDIQNEIFYGLKLVLYCNNVYCECLLYKKIIKLFFK